jgi:hypothetical protein
MAGTRAAPSKRTSMIDQTLDTELIRAIAHDIRSSLLAVHCAIADLGRDLRATIGTHRSPTFTVAEAGVARLLQLADELNGLASAQGAAVARAPAKLRS